MHNIPSVARMGERLALICLSAFRLALIKLGTKLAADGNAEFIFYTF